ncbi:MAG: polyprenyl synthetase family protein, partial [Kibdelosporangium sp.]
MTADNRSPREVLTWSRALVEPAMRDAVDSLPGSMRLIAGYHYGWWDAQGQAAQADGGKALRPTLVLLGAQAVGGLAAAAIPAPVAIQQVHQITVLQD